MLIIGARFDRMVQRARLGLIVLTAAFGVQAGTFGDNGVAIPPIYLPGGDSTTAAVLRQSDGKLIVAGSAEGPIGTTMFAARFLASGALDASYGTGGIAYVPLPIDIGSIQGANNQGLGAALDAQENVILVGWLSTSSPPFASMAVARLTANGSPDATFGPDGLREITLPGYAPAYATRVAVDAAGNIAIAGLAYSLTAPGAAMAVVRMTVTGSLDTSFNGMGYRIFNLASYTDIPTGLAVDPNGNIIVAGIDDATSATPFAVIRLTPTGQYDLSFNGTGITHLEWGDAIALDSNGNIVVAASGPATAYSLFVTRLTAAGIHDPAFASGAWVEFDLSNNLLSLNAAHQVGIDHNGRIMVALTGFNPQGFALAAARFTSGGTIDSTFNGNGLQTVPADWALPYHQEAALAIDSGDNVVIVGPHYDRHSTLPVTDELIARITASGSLDPTFNGTGSVIQNCGVRQLTTTAMARQADGKIVLAGYTGVLNQPRSDSLVARLTASGALDTAFNGTGFREIAEISPAGAESPTLAIDSGGRIVVAGRDADNNFAVARLTSSGATDGTFNGAGITTVPGARPGSMGASVVAVDPSGNILVLGLAPVQTGSGFLVIRLTPSGALDPIFGNGGIASIAFNNQLASNGAGLALDTAGRIVFGGSVQNQANTYLNWVVGRLTPSGALDSTFGSNGIVTLTKTPNIYYEELLALVIDGSDRIVLAGTEGPPAVKRFTSTGQLDPTFNGTGTLFYTDRNATASFLALAIEPAGKILVGGEAFVPWPDNRFEMLALRILPDGTIDPAFNAGQTMFLSVAPGSLGDRAAAVAADGSGGIYLGGSTGRSMAVVKLFDGTPTILGVASINAGVPPVVFLPFDVVIEAQDDNGNPQPVLNATSIALSLASGTGILSGNLSCMIPAGSTACRLNVTYSKLEFIALTASATAGDALGTVSSSLFEVTRSSSTTTLAVDTNPSVFGQNVTFTVTVTAVDPTGYVSLSDEYGLVPGCGSVVLTGTGNAKTATCGTTQLVTGTHHIGALYYGDTFTDPSGSATIVLVVNSVPNTNVALASAGAVAFASSNFSALYWVSAINNGDRAGLNFGSGGVWKDATPGTFPDWVEIDFSGTQTIDRVIVYSVQDNNLNPVDPSDTLTFNHFGLTAFDVQTWNGSSWTTQVSVTGNNLVKRTVSFSPTTTQRIRVLINGAASSGKKGGAYSYLAEVEAWTPAAAPPPGTTVASSANPGKVGQPITFTGSVAGPNPIGTVAFTSNGTTIAGCATVPLTGAGNVRTATCNTTFGSAGTYAIVGSYSGGGGNPPSASAPLAEVIKKKRH